MLERALSSSIGVLGIVEIFVEQQRAFLCLSQETDAAIAPTTEPAAEGARLVVVVAAEALVVARRLLASPAFAPDRRSRPDLPPDALEVLALASGTGPAGGGVDFGARLHGIGDAECGDGEFLLAVRAVLLGHYHGRPKDDGSHHLNVSGGNEADALLCGNISS